MTVAYRDVSVSGEGDGGDGAGAEPEAEGEVQLVRGGGHQHPVLVCSPVVGEVILQQTTITNSGQLCGGGERRTTQIVDCR